MEGHVVATTTIAFHAGSRIDLPGQLLEEIRQKLLEKNIDEDLSRNGVKTGDGRGESCDRLEPAAEQGLLSWEDCYDGDQPLEPMNGDTDTDASQHVMVGTAVVSQDHNHSKANSAENTTDGRNSGTILSASVKRMKEVVMMCCEEVEAQGFAGEEVEKSIRLVVQSCIGQVQTSNRWIVRSAVELVEYVLNDLLWRLDRDSLPAFYADQTKPVVDAQVKIRSQERKLQHGGDKEEVVHDCVDVHAQDMSHRLLKQEQENEYIKKVQEKKNEEWKQSKAWILQNAYGSSDDAWTSEESEQDDADADEDIEDWEIWGDPREVERRKAERARNQLSREARIQLIKNDMEKARENAAKAKQRNDKNAQKEAGSIIGQLKREMLALGITEEDLSAMGDVASSQASTLQAEKTDDRGRKESSDDEAVMDFDLFEGPEDDAYDNEKMRKAEDKEKYLSILSNINLRQADRKKSKSKHTAGEPDVVKKQPKALLQQLLQKEGWGAPRFEKLPIGGECQANGHRFQVLIDVKKGKFKKSKNRPGLHRFFLDPRMDGWDSIQSAQNGCSTKALVELFGDSPDVPWDQLESPFDVLVMDIINISPEESLIENERKLQRERFAESMADMLISRNVQWGEGPEQEGDSVGQNLGLQDIKSSIKAHKSHLMTINIQKKNQLLKKKHENWLDSDEGRFWTRKRSELPVSRIQEDLFDSLQTNDVIVVCGETGSGKTTQIPQMILDDSIINGSGGECSIVCTQPRRIAAMSVADRVSEERGESGPGKSGSLVGYSVRFDSAVTSESRLVFCTTGILLRRMASEPGIAALSHVIVDEVHERSMQSDFLIAMLRDLVDMRRSQGLPLKVVLMSATMNAQMVSDYFGGCPVLSASGRTFPVKHLFLEDVYEKTGYILDTDSPCCLRDNVPYRERQKVLENSSGSRKKGIIRSQWGDETGDSILNPHYDTSDYLNYSENTRRNLALVNEDRIDMELLEDTVIHVHEKYGDGSILVFVPGMAEIDNLRRRLETHRSLQGHVIVPLHSSISPAEQRKAFKLFPTGTRKIVISTNIAETSVTIEDIVYVIDTGKLKERRYDPSRSMSMLVEDTIAVANANQRKGRAGRVQEGVCFALYTRQCYEKRMKKYQTPEIMRVPLEELVLQIHHLKLSETADQFLSKVLQPPAKKAVSSAIQSLRDIGALSKDESLTALGHQLARLPVDVGIGKILIMGSLLHCISPALSIAACLSHKSPFSLQLDKEDFRKIASPFLKKDSPYIASGQQSDALVMASAIQGWITARAKGGKSSAIQYAKNNSISIQNVEIIMEMRRQFANMLAEAGLLEKQTSQQLTHGTEWFDSDSCPQNSNMNAPEIVQACITAALFPNVACMGDVSPHSIPSWLDSGGETVVIHPSSTLAQLHATSFQRPFLVFSEKMRTSKVFMRECSVASPVSLFLFGGALNIDHRNGTAIIDGWIRLRIPARCAVVLMRLRDSMDKYMSTKVGSAAMVKRSNAPMQYPPSNTSPVDLLVRVLRRDLDSLSLWHST